MAAVQAFPQAWCLQYVKQLTLVARSDPSESVREATKGCLRSIEDSAMPLVGPPPPKAAKAAAMATIAAPSGFSLSPCQIAETETP